MAQTNLTKHEASERLIRLAEVLEQHLEISADPFGNVTILHRATGSHLTFTTHGDIQVKPRQDVDMKSGRWVHVNSDVRKIQARKGRVIYGPKGEILRAW